MTGVMDPTVPEQLRTPASLVELRRSIHREPELRFGEHRTAGLVADRLRVSGYTVRTDVGGTGVLAWRTGPAAGPHVVVRADLDALPIDDLKTVPYASIHPGAAHACGHDVHTAVVVGVAERLARTSLPRGRVSFVFQPAEERPFGEPSGARAVMDAGVFADARVDAVLGLHCWPDLPVGSVGIDERIAMAAKDAFRVRLRGRTAHAAAPSRGRDALLGIAQLVTALHQGFARSLDPGELAVLNLGTVHGGQSQSVVADQAEVTGTLRTVEPEVRTRLRATIERITAGVATMADVDPALTWADEMPAIVNDPRLAACARAVAEDLVGRTSTRILTSPPMTTDDFALFAEIAPLLYLKLGVCGDASCPPLHNGAFDVDERAIGIGVGVIAEIVRRLLSRSVAEWDSDAGAPR